MTIPTLSTQPNSVTRPAYFNTDSDTFHSEFPSVITAINDTAALMNLYASAGITYTFDTTTTDADPGNGKLRLDNATQNAATTIRADLLDSNGADWTNALAALGTGTSTIKGRVLIYKTSDPTKWLYFHVTAVASPSGYKNITVVCDASSAASPLTNSDGITLKISVNGDKGDTGATGAAGPNATVVDKGNSGTSLQTLDYSAGTYQKITATGSHTIATSNWPTTGSLGVMQVEMVNGGAYTITMPTINWQLPAGGYTTTFSTYLAAINRAALQSSGTDQWVWWTRDGGTTVYGKLI